MSTRARKLPKQGTSLRTAAKRAARTLTRSVLPLLPVFTVTLTSACGGEPATDPIMTLDGGTTTTMMPDAEPPATIGDFEISAPATALLRAEGTTTFEVTVTRSDGFAAPVGVEVLDLAEGVTAEVDPPGTGPTVKVTLTAGMTPGLGERTIKLRASGPDTQRETAMKLVVAGKPGNLDTAFASNGVLAMNGGGAGTSLVAGPDGRLYVGLSVPGPGAGVARLSPDGELDTTFGNGGIKAFSFGPTAAASSWARHLAVLADGSILAAGAAGGRACITKLDANGDKVATFGDNGDACLATGADDAFEGLRVLDDGSILAVGARNGSSAESDVFVAKLAPDGKLALFGTNGIATLSRAGGQYPIGIAVDSKQRVVVGATCDDANAGCVWRLTPQGYPDFAFEGGLAIGAPHPGFVGTSFLVDATDTTYVTGVPNSQTGVHAFDESGKAPAGFGVDGWLTVDGPLEREGVLHAVYDGGQLVTCGSADTPGADPGILPFVGRVDLAAQKVDETFGLGGATMLPIGQFGSDITLQEHRAVILVTTFGSEFGLVRVWR